MAPTPIEDIGYPSLIDKFLELLRAIQSAIAHAFLAVWTWPPFESFRHALVTFSVSIKDYATAHPVSAVAIAILAVFVLPVLLVLVIRAIRAIVLFVFVIVGAVILFVFGIVLVVCNAITLLLLHCLGFRTEGVLLDPYAVNYQSTGYGGNVLRGSTFAQFQSLAAKAGYRPVSGAVGTTVGSTSWR